MKAYVLLDIRPGTEGEILQKLSSIENTCNCVKSTDIVYGSHDIIVVLEGDYETIDKNIMQIRKLPSIHKSESLLSFEPKAWDELS